MAETWEIFGHQAVKNLLQAQFEGGHLSHAYLFRGPEALGKKSLALEFAKKVLAAKELANHPDFSILDAKGEITVERIHEFMRPLAFKPFAGGKKVAILNNAQNLNTQSGNALLKTLEEPSNSTIIILVASGFVLPTIVSRCQIFYFYPASNQELESYATNHKIDAQILELSFGRLGRIRNLISDPNLLSQNQKNITDLKKLMADSVGQRLSEVARFAELELPDLEQLLQTWTLWLRFELTKSPQKFRALQSCLEALFSLKANQNKKLILQSLFLKI